MELRTLIVDDELIAHRVLREKPELICGVEENLQSGDRGWRFVRKLKDGPHP